MSSVRGVAKRKKKDPGENIHIEAIGSRLIDYL